WNASVDSLQIRNTSIQAGRRTVGVDTPPASFSGTGGFNGFNAETWFLTSGWGNIGTAPRQPSAVGLGAAAFVMGVGTDPRPALGSEPVTAGTNFSNPRLNGFITTTYRGAFDPALPMNQQWTAGWTNFDPQNTNYLTSVKEVSQTVPQRFELGQNYPNPFNPTTNIQFQIPKNSFVTLKVYNMLGQEVATLVNQQLSAGSFVADFDAANLASGSYIYRLSADGAVQSRKMVLMR
ncbi:T9SS type A sorting domain-containing protein, partial [Sphingobacteriales bacterium CHB3]|nr:T9SS type A sorting domain-containing protein [Sphingobacteriales bacterium CHB3]